MCSFGVHFVLLLSHCVRIKLLLANFSIKGGLKPYIVNAMPSMRNVDSVGSKFVTMMMKIMMTMMMVVMMMFQKVMK